MNIYKMIKNILVIFLLCASFIIAHAQNTTLLWDATNHMPVSHASVFTTDKGKTKGTFSDEHGIVSVDFPFNKLEISHVNYEHLEVSSLSDTIFLVPSVYLLGEVSVKPYEPEWIRTKLEDFVENKKHQYTLTYTVKYRYTSQNLGSNSLYSFISEGFVSHNENFFILPTNDTIIYKDKTAGCDFTNLKSILYHDFVTDLDNSFIKDHRFFVDEEYHDANRNIVRIGFKSTKYSKDFGAFLLDTVNNVIVKARRSSGLEYNVKDKTNALVRSTFSFFSGHKFKAWNIDYDVQYDRNGDSWYVSSCRYNNLMWDEFKSNKFSGQFTHISSVYEANPSNQTDISSGKFIVLPEPYVMKIVMTKKERLNEEALQKVPKSYKIY